MTISAERRERVERIRDHALELFARDDICDCKALAELVQYAINDNTPSMAASSPGPDYTASDLVGDLALVLTERTESGLSTRTEDTDLYLGYGYAGDSCFRSIFQDGSNQVRHFWGYVMLGVSLGYAAGSYICLIREISILEYADYNLGVAGLTLGHKLGWAQLTGDTDLDFVSDWIKKYVCK